MKVDRRTELDAILEAFEIRWRPFSKITREQWEAEFSECIGKVIAWASMLGMDAAKQVAFENATTHIIEAVRKRGSDDTR